MTAVPFTASARSGGRADRRDLPGRDGGRPTAAGRGLRHDPVPERGRRRRPEFRPPAYPDAGTALRRERARRRRGVRLQRRRPARHLLHQRRRDAVARQDRPGGTPTASTATTAACASPTSPTRPASAASATRWARRPPTTTTTATSTCSWPGVGSNQLLRNRGDGALRGRDGARRHRQRRVGRRRPAGSTTTTTAGSICSSSTTCSGRAQTNRYCGDQARGIRIYCHPRYFQGLPNRLYRNRGDGTFEDVSARAGLADARRQGHERRLRRLRPRRATSTRSSPTTRCRTSCSATTATARSARTALTRRRVRAGLGPADLRHGRGLPGLRQRRLGGHPLHRRSPARRSRCSATTRPRARHLRRGDAVERARRADGQVCRAGARCSRTSTTTAGRISSPPTRTPNDRIGEFGGARLEAAEQPVPQRRPRAVPRRHRRVGPRGAVAAVHRGCGVADFNGDGRLDIVVLALGEPAELWQNESAPGDRSWLIVRLVGDQQQPRRHRRARHSSAIRCGP